MRSIFQLQIFVLILGLVVPLATTFGASKTRSRAKSTVAVCPQEATIAGATQSHLASDGVSYAILRRAENSYYVRVNAAEFGPFEDTDVSEFSPFKNSINCWSFRARTAAGIVLVLGGQQFGPYQEVWRVRISDDGQWGCLIKSDNRYWILANGNLSEGFDEIAGDHQLDPFDLHRASDPDLPMFFGSQQWGAIARRGTDRLIVTNEKVHGPYVAIGEVKFGSEVAAVSPPALHRLLCLDRSKFAVGVSRKKDSTTTTHHLWINGSEHGVYSEIPALAALRDMSINGNAWVFNGPGLVHSHLGSVQRNPVSIAFVNDSGSTIFYTYGNDGDARFVIGQQEFGPYLQARVPGVSPCGDRWIAGFKAKEDQQWYVQTESGKTGPFAEVIRTSFQGDKSLAEVKLAEGKLAVIIDGVVHGPYPNYTIYPVYPDRTIDRSWAISASGPDRRMEIFSSGTQVGTVGPLETMTLLRAWDSNWSGLGKLGGKFYIAEKGLMSGSLGPFKNLINHFHSADASRIALMAIDNNDKYLVVMREQTHGPYDQMPLPVEFSPDGTHWGFRLPVAAGKLRLIHSLGESPDYDAIQGRFVSYRGSAFVGVRGTQSYVHIGNQQYGPYEAAGIQLCGTKILGIVVEQGKIKLLQY